MPISEAVLRRRQLDLDKRTAELNEYLELQTFDAMKDMPKYWRQLDRDITAKIAALYKKMGATQDPAKLKVLIGKMDRLDAYVKQIRADIDRYTYGFDTWTTGQLKHHFEKSYYMNGWVLEQASKVTASIPVLSPAQVLGVLCNPWLPDGNNYSRRIRANADLLAYEVKGVVEHAVKQGIGWNETARLISQATEENHFRAVTLARTEMTRAQALGSSYSYIQNNDILDSKRWNAVRDSRTAPKDAANHNQTFDLEYDTPGNPGVPGKRIPNHPNCRCIWSPVLSALGINNREVIARGEGDTPTNYGERIWVQAPTYREYAKLRGLPDLDDRLANDNLSRYLRPGESLEDLKKNVKRFTLNGNTINAPLPDWAHSKEAAPIITKRGQPSITEKLSKVVGNHFKSDKIGSGTNAERKAMAQEMLNACGLGDIPISVRDLNGSFGACSLDYRSSNMMEILNYNLTSKDDRSDAFKVKTAFHELFHAASNGIEHDITTAGYTFANWVEVEETFTESAAHYLAREAGITGLHPSYGQKLVSNLPKLKKLEMFKNCDTIEDFGEIMVKYRMVEKKPSNWKQFFDIISNTEDPAPYILKHYKEYIDNNFDSIYEQIAGNVPVLQANPDLKVQAKAAWEDTVNYGRMPAGGNKRAFMFDIATAAMKATGVR